MSERPSDFPYIHGFTDSEQTRLRRQARMTESLIFRDIEFSSCRSLLEVGSGVGAQTEILLRRFPDLKVTGIDLSENQAQAARTNLARIPWCVDRFDIQVMDAGNMDFPGRSFDGAFLCWVLEHVADPRRVLSEVRRVLRSGSTVYVNEVMNASFLLDPYSPNLWKYWMAFNDYQHEMGGDPFVGAKLGNLLLACGYQQVETTIKTFHLDNRQPDRRKEMIAFWEELLLSAADQLIESGQVTQEIVSAMHEEVQQVQNDPNAVFFYSFVQARGAVIS